MIRVRSYPQHPKDDPRNHTKPTRTITNYRNQLTADHGQRTTDNGQRPKTVFSNPCHPCSSVAKSFLCLFQIRVFRVNPRPMLCLLLFQIRIIRVHLWPDHLRT
jgi:hypothetical protein